jgi:predicted transcriptional regulator
VSTKYLELTKKQGAMMTEYIEKEFAKTNETDQEICDSMQQMRQKVQDMEKEKKNDTK